MKEAIQIKCDAPNNKSKITSFKKNVYLNKSFSIKLMNKIFALFLFGWFSNFVFGQLIDGGNGHALILDKQGNVWAIGRNDFGQLGDSSHVNSSIPKRVNNLKNIVAISRGYDHSIALDKFGDIYLWGRNNYLQIGISSVNDQTTPQKLKNHSDFIAIEGGHWHSVALKKDGTVWTWGHNYYAELGSGNREHSSWPVQVIQLKNGVKSKLNGVRKIASVGYHTLALKEDGTVWGWGGNSFKELGGEGDEFQTCAIQLKGLPKIKEIAVGWHHSIALDIEGKVWIWGSDPASQFKESTLRYYEKPTRLDELPKITKIACGSWHSLAIDENQQVWGWGRNHFGMLGTNDTISHSKPIQIKSLENIVDIGGGCFQSFAVDKSGNIFTFGDNPFGQLGTGDYTRCYSPKLMAINMDGFIDESRLKKVKKPEKSPAPKKNKFQELIFKILKYGLFTLSIAFNIYLLRRLQKLRK